MKALFAALAAINIGIAVFSAMHGMNVSAAVNAGAAMFSILLNFTGRN